MSLSCFKHKGTPLKKNFVTKFSISINLPNTPIDVLKITDLDHEVFHKYLIDKNIRIGYVCTRENGKHPPESSHWHLWCHASTPIRRDYFLKYYLKPFIRAAGFSDKKCTAKDGVYRAIKCNKVRETEHDIKYSLGYVLKEVDFDHCGSLMMNCVFNPHQPLRRGEGQAYLLEAKAYYILNKKSSYTNPDTPDGLCISEIKTLRFLKNFGDPSLNNAEKVFIAHHQGYELMCLKKSVRLKRLLSFKSKIYIYCMFGIHMDEWDPKVLKYHIYCQKKENSKTKGN